MQNFLYPCQINPLKLTEGPQAHMAGHAGRWPGQLGPWRAESRPALRRRFRPRGGRGRDPGGPPAYPRLAGEVGWTGGRPVAADFGGDEIRSGE
jgi:hypothetical protein